jgi:hypothetical protein
METTEKKPLNEYKLNQTNKGLRTKKGVKGFQKLDKPKEDVIQIRVSGDVKDFINSFCVKNGITKTQLIMGSLECYTGFNGTNAKEILSIPQLVFINE